MSETTARHAEDDFVHARQADARLTPADFHRWLTVARLLAGAMGDDELRVGHWERMRKLEGERLDRLEKRRGPAFGGSGVRGGVGVSPQSVSAMTT